MGDGRVSSTQLRAGTSGGERTHADGGHAEPRGAVHAQDTREKALARFSRPPTTDEQDLDVYFVYKTECGT